MSGSHVRRSLDRYHQEVASIILSRQNPATGLIPASVAITTHGDYRDAWVRDNVYSIFSVWGLALAYRRIDDDDGRGYELEHATIKTMRGLLSSMMRQADKVELFKNTQAVHHALHAKYNTQTGGTVVGDHEWGHLQIDATSIFLLALAQMTASGLRLIFTMDEVHFVQNLVFYIERAYRTPDYGVWERGNKVNHGQPELNSSSIGMAAAALEAINGINLFGVRGGPASAIHVLPDELTRNYTTLHSALPRESASKEIDAALLAVISFPAFALHDPELAARTRNDIVKKLGGNYGFKRFLRDGHQTVLEDTTRLHYDPAELKMFEGVESEWPLFYTYMILDGLFRDDQDQVHQYRRMLEPLLVDSARIPKFNRDHVAHEPQDGPPARSPSITKRTLPPANMRLVPELFIVPRQLVEAEKADPGSQHRVPNENVPLVWAQSLYILGNLIYDDLLSVSELDPLGRRIAANRPRNQTEVVVQVVLLSEDEDLQQRLLKFGLDTQTADNCGPVTISPPSALRDAYTALGENQKLKLTGRPKRPIGTLGTSKLYRCQGRLYAFTPHFMDSEEFYLVSDNDYLVSLFEQELSFVKNHWKAPGRPTMVVMLTREMLGGLRNSETRAKRWRSHSGHSSRRNLLNFMMSLRSGHVGNVRVRTGRLTDMINTTCIESLDFLVSKECSEYEDWETLLRGEPMQYHKSSKLSCSEHDTEETSKERISSAGSLHPRRRIRRRASMDLVQQGAKSPLASPWYTDEPLVSDAFMLHDHVDEDLRPELGLTEEQPIRVHSPIKGLALNLFEAVESAVEPIISTAADLDGKPSPISEDGEDDQKDSDTSPTPAHPILTLTLNDPARTIDAIHLLEKSANLYDQVDLLHYLLSCHGIEYEVPGLAIVAALLEEVYVKAMHLRQWSIVRQAAGLLRKTVNALTINVADLLIRQRPVTVGFGGDEIFMTSPMHPAALKTLIYTHCASDVREAPLVQEVLTYLGSFIRGDPHMFQGIMRIRTHFFIIAMREEISRMRGCNEEEAVEHLMQLSPYEMKSLLGQVLAAHETCNVPVTSTGALSRTGVVPSRWRNFAQVQVQHTPGAKTAAAATLKLSDLAASLPSELVINVQSAGFNAGNFCKLEVRADGVAIPSRGVFGRGLNVTVLDSVEGAVLERASFDTHISREESDEFARLIELLEPGLLVIITAMDDAAENLTDAAQAACERLGSVHVRNLRYRDSWCLIGERGAEPGSVPEAHSPAGTSQPTPVVTKTVDLAQRRLNLLSPHGSSSVAAAAANALPALTLLLPSQGRWLRRRKNDGALNRVPHDFYPKVWNVLSKTEGIIVGRQFLPSNPTVYEKTAEELNFALQVESMLDVIRDPAERQIAVECLMVVSRIGERNPEIRLRKGCLEVMAIIRDAIERFWEGWVRDNDVLKAIGQQMAGAMGADEAAEDENSAGSPPSAFTSSSSLMTSSVSGRGGRGGLSVHTNTEGRATPLCASIDGTSVPSLTRAAIHGATPTNSSATTMTPSSTTSTAAASVRPSLLNPQETRDSTTATTPPATNPPPRAATFAETWAFERHERLARRLFFDLPQEGDTNTSREEGGAGTMEYLAESCVRLICDVRIGGGF
ncbi:glycosyl hydrolases family 15-domain-containing protein [Phlyctochytrium arcticum]|nr:glycosyl hydrolases family 15-domain-containing protein [Phlyctochytrium arcticum]